MALLAMMLFVCCASGFGVGIVSSGKVSSMSVCCLLVEGEVKEQNVGSERQSGQQYRLLLPDT